MIRMPRAAPSGRTNFRTPRNDCSYAGARIRYLVGPLDNIDDPDQLRRRLRTIASGGPSNRIGLSPDRNSPRWMFDPSCSNVVITELPDVDVSDPTKTLADFASVADDATMRIGVSNRWLLIDFDHGLGGGRLLTEIVAGVTSDDPGFAEPKPYTDCRRPTLRALAHTFRSTPCSSVKAMSEAFRHPAGVATRGRFDDTVDLAYARSTPNFLHHLRASRDKNHPGVSVLALVIAAFLRSLHARGITPTEYTNVMVDLNRYLPSNTGTLSNFIGMAPLKVPEPFDPTAIGSSLDEYTNGSRSLVRYGLSSIAQLIHPPRELGSWRANSEAANVVVSDHRMTAASRKIRWAPDGERIFVSMLAVNYDHQITLAPSTVEGELHLTASFYSSALDRDVVQSALGDVVGSAGDLARLGTYA